MSPNQKEVLMEAELELLGLAVSLSKKEGMEEPIQKIGRCLALIRKLDQTEVEDHERSEAA